MKKFNDVKIYFWFVMVTLAVAIILGALSFYSILYVEPKISKLLDAGSKVVVAEKATDAEKAEALQKADGYFKEAYIMLRNPEIFGRYENFDGDSEGIRRVLGYFDKVVYEKGIISPKEGVYLNLLLERRVQGSRLGRNTMVFFFILSFIGLAFLMYEKRSVKKAV
jgi:hypothetical protein